MSQRLDADLLLIRTPVLETWQDCLLLTDAATRAPRLDELTALVAEAATAFANRGPATIVLASRPAHLFFAADCYAFAAARTRLSEETVRGRVAELGAGNSKLGLRGARWVIADPPLHEAVALGLREALGPLTLLLPGVSAPEEMRAARAALGGVATRWGAGLDTARGCLLRSAIATQADFIEVESYRLTETTFALSGDDAVGFLPAMIAAGALSADPFVTPDPAIARLVDGRIPHLSAPSEPPPPPTRPQNLGAHEHLARVVALPAREALLATPPELVAELARPVLAVDGVSPLSVAIGAVGGGGVGRVALSPATAVQPFVLVVQEVYAEEAAAVRRAAALVSVRGGRTSHAAVVAAQAGVPCVMDEDVRIDLARRVVVIGGYEVAEGDWLSVDGTVGAIYQAALPLAPVAPSHGLARLLGWADAHRRLEVRANADTANEARAALAAGATGIGLVRTEHMFLDGRRLGALRAAIIGGDAASLRRLEELQIEDFAAWFDAVGSHPIVFRLLDAPLWEFLPHDRAGVEMLAHAIGVSTDEAARRVEREQPIDSMMALRALRLSVVRPELERAQMRALAIAWSRAASPAPLRVTAPMVTGGEEMAAAAARLRSIIDVPLELGAMMEVPRAALEADRIAPNAAWFSWGTNDLTQFTLGLGRNVAPRVLPSLRAAGALDVDPDQTLELRGVGLLIRIGEALGRAARPDLVTGVCGRLAADPRSIYAFHKLGLDFVSVPPAQVAAARLAAAQAALQ